MRIGITGVTGFIGKKLATLAQGQGHEVIGFSRKAHTTLPHCKEVRLFADGQAVNVGGLDALVHLAGEPVLGYWTAAKKERILRSRRETTRQLVQAMSAATERPAVFLCASGTGFYGDQGSQPLDESAGKGSGFLAEVAATWEEEASKAAQAGVRVVSLRTGLVLGLESGAFPILRLVFSLGLGGKLGSGAQFFPWIHIDDMAALYLYCAVTESVRGPVNAVAPDAETNAEFTRSLARAVHRPAIFGVPGWVLKTVLREQSAMLLDSQRAVPKAALESGFTFAHPEMEGALRDLLSGQ